MVKVLMRTSLILTGRPFHAWILSPEEGGGKIGFRQCDPAK